VQSYSKIKLLNLRTSVLGNRKLL